MLLSKNRVPGSLLARARGLAWPRKTLLAGWLTSQVNRGMHGDIDVLGDARIVANGEYSTEVILLNANESHFRL